MRRLSEQTDSISEDNNDQHGQYTRKKILIVDDNPMVRTLLRTMITKMGHHCLSANDGLEAIAKAKEEVFDAIVIDMQMPHMGKFYFSFLLAYCF